MNERAGVVSIFVGDFPSEEAADQYFEEHYGEGPDDDDLPLSKFAGDFDIDFYDEGMFEHAYVASGDHSLRAMLAAASYSSSFLDAVVQRGRELGRTEANTVALLYDIECTSPAPNSPLTYLGSFPYDMDAPSAAELS